MISFKNFLKPRTPTYVYHGTKAHHIENIRTGGLKAVTNHFHKNEKYASQWAEKNSLLRVDQKHLGSHSEQDGHVWTKRAVHPKHIEVYHDNEWKRLQEDQMTEGDVVPFPRPKPVFGPNTQIKFKPVGLKNNFELPQKYPKAYEKLKHDPDSVAAYTHEIHADGQHVGWLITRRYKNKLQEYQTTHAYDLNGDPIQVERVPLSELK